MKRNFILEGQLLSVENKLTISHFLYLLTESTYRWPHVHSDRSSDAVVSYMHAGDTGNTQQVSD